MSVREIFEALNANKYGQARSLLSSALAASPANGSYLGMLAFLEFKQNNISEALDVAKQSVLNGPLSQVVITSFLAPVLTVLGDGQLLNTAYEGLARVSAPSEQMLDEWAGYEFDMAYLKGLLKVHTEINKRRSTRSTIINCCFFMALENDELLEGDPARRLYPVLAERMIERAMPYSTPQEAYVYALVLKMSAPKKMIDFLLEEKQQQLQSLDLNVLLLDALVKEQLWDTVYDISKKRLLEIDSYNYWQTLNDATLKLGKSDQWDDFANKFKGHNVSVARLDFAKKSGMSLEKAIDAYWQTMKDRTCVLEDLRPFLNDELLKFVNQQTPASLTEKVNIAKLNYLWTKKVSVAEMVKLYRTNLDQLPKEKTDYFVGDDAMLLAALEVLSGDAEFKLEKAAIILEWTINNDPSQFYVRIWLIKLYQVMGAFSKAVQHYEKLEIKNMQLESLGHLVLTRNGTLSPNRSLIRDHKTIYSQSDDLGSYSRAALSRGAYTQIPGMLDLTRRMTNSLSRAFLSIEGLKAERVLKGTTSLADVLTQPVGHLSDNRDYTVTFDPLGTVGAKVETGPRPGKQWAKVQVAKEKLYLQAIRGVSKSSAAVSTDSSELTDYEKWNVSVVNHLAAGNMDDWNVPLPHPSYDKYWEFFHGCYSILETCKITEDYAAKHKTRVPMKVSKSRVDVQDAARAALADSNDYPKETVAAIESWASELEIPNAGSVLQSVCASRGRALTSLSSLRS